MSAMSQPWGDRESRGEAPWHAAQPAEPPQAEPSRTKPSKAEPASAEPAQGGTSATARGGWSPGPEGDPWGQGRGAVATAIAASEVQGPALVPLLIGCVLALLGLGVGIAALGRHGLGLGIAGWLLSGPGAIGLLAAFVLADSRRRQRAWYVPSRLAGWLRRVLVVAALAAVVACAWAIADVVARW